MKKDQFFSSDEADELSRLVTNERVKQAGVDLSQIENDPDLAPLATALKASRKKRSTKSPYPPAMIKKLAGY